MSLFLILLLAVSILAILAERLGISYSIAFVLGGLLIALIPDLPQAVIDPEWMLVLFLPPLLMEAAYFTSFRDFRENLRPILQLAIGAVIVSSLGVAYVFMQLVPDASWALALTLGAIVSPPDAVAAKSGLSRVQLPKRIVTVLEGESLVNDATGLVLYKIALAAVVSGTFSAAQLPVDFIWAATMGTLIGVGLGYFYMSLFPLIRERSVEILSTFMVPYGAYLLAEGLHASGVLAVVAAGLVIGWRAPRIFSPEFRIPANAVWQMVVFVLNGIVFVLIGMQFPELLARLASYSSMTLLSYASAVSGTAIFVRIVWVYALTYGTRFFFPSIRRKDPYPPWQNVFIVAWTGMRGVVSLATALALPLTLEGGSAFPHRDLIIFLAFSVILVTLVLQGLTLPLIARKLTLTYDFQALMEDWNARFAAITNALAKLNGISRDNHDYASAVARIRSYYEDRLASLGDGPNTPLSTKEPPMAENHPSVVAEHCIWQEVLDAERETILKKRHSYEIGDDIMHNLLREIDLMAARFKSLG